MNWGLLGHEWAVNLLREHAANERLRHAYLFTGPQGIGRRTLGIRLFQALNCSQPPAPGEPCLACRNCTQLGNMQYPDLSVVRPDTAGSQIRVEQVRDLQHNLSLAPYAGRYRTALLLNFEQANPNASNALLKTLEEPPAQVLLVVTAESAEQLLPTIVSRCEVLRLRPLPLDTVEAGLQERWSLTAERARLLAHLSSGRLGYALQLNQDETRLEKRQAWLDDHQRLLSASRVERFAYAEAISKDKDGLRSLLQTWASLWRDVLLQASGARTPLTNTDQAEEVSHLTAGLTLETAHQTLQAIERLMDRLDKNANPRLASEVFLLDLPRLP